MFMVYRKIIFSVLGILIIVVAFFIFITPRGGTHTYYEDVFYSRFYIESFEENIFSILLNNQTRYQFTLSTASKSDVNADVFILDSFKNQISILDFRDFGGAIRGEFNSKNSGNYTFSITEPKENYSYTADFNVNQRIDEYYPTGGRYGNVNNAIKNIPAVFLSFIGFGFILSAFWKEITKIWRTIREGSTPWQL